MMSYARNRMCSGPASAIIGDLSVSPPMKGSQLLHWRTPHGRWGFVRPNKGAKSLPRVGTHRSGKIGSFSPLNNDPLYLIRYYNNKKDTEIYMSCRKALGKD